GGTHALYFVSPVQSFFGVAHELRVDDGNVPGDLEGGGEVFAIGDDARDDAESEGALGGEGVIAGEDDVLRGLGADHPGQQHGDDAGAELELGLAEGGVLRAHGKDARERHLDVDCHDGY